MDRIAGTLPTVLVIVLLCGVLAPAATAQQVDLSPFQISVACAPAPATSTDTPRPLRVVGAADTVAVARSLFDRRDQLVINAGTAAGLRSGQEYFLRRTAWGVVYSAELEDGGRRIRGMRIRGGAGLGAPGRGRAITTDGWVRIVSVDRNRAVAIVEHACGAIHEDDYLEPFEPPAVGPAGPGIGAAAPAFTPDVRQSDVRQSGQDLAILGRVAFADDERAIAAAGDFVVVGSGAAQTTPPGTRLAIYREVSTSPLSYGEPGRAARLPPALVAEAVVVSTGRRMTVARILGSRDAVWSGDVVAQVFP